MWIALIIGLTVANLFMTGFLLTFFERNKKHMVVLGDDAYFAAIFWPISLPIAFGSRLGHGRKDIK